MIFLVENYSLSSSMGYKNINSKNVSPATVFGKIFEENCYFGQVLEKVYADI